MLSSGRFVARAVNLMKAGCVQHRLRPRLASARPLSPRILTGPSIGRCLCSGNDSREKDDKVTKIAEKDEPKARKDSTSDGPVSPHLRDKFVLFEDEDAQVILDIHEEFQQAQGGIVYFPEKWDPNESPLSEKPPVEHNLQRGLTGVYDVEDLVAVLESENTVDICVIQMPEEMFYADYIVVASARSTRHLKAVMEFVRKLYKKKMDKSDKMANVQGEDCKTWLALDMGNIVLHLMLPLERNRYDIETLWAVGEKYDDNCVRPEDAEASILQQHLDLLESWTPLPAETTEPALR